MCVPVQPSRRALHLDSGIQSSRRLERRGCEVLAPTLPWEQTLQPRVGNPFVFFNALTSSFWLYYSAAAVNLADSNIQEPLHLGAAQAASLDGPWARLSNSPLRISGGALNGSSSYIGVGALRLIKGLGAPGSCAAGSAACLADNRVLALVNRITLDAATQRTGSTISLVSTGGSGAGAGLNWTVLGQPGFIAPTPSASPATWKQGYVYAHDTIQDPLDAAFVLAFYNGRDGWKSAKETIGVSRFHLDVGGTYM